MADNSITHQDWFNFLTPEQQTSVQISLSLSKQASLNPIFEDFSYIFFPMARAYEGFLKKYLFEQGLISEHVYHGKRFRIGRSLNPDVHMNQRDQYWLFDDVSALCGKDTARQIWETWLQCRNRVFHYFVKDPRQLSLQQANEYQQLMIQTMDDTFHCLINSKK